MNSVPAGWFPSPEDPAQLRYWDGAQWTHHTAPAVAADPVPTPQAAPAPVYSAPQAPTGQQFAPPAPTPVTAGAANSTKKWLIGGAIAAGVIVVGSVGAAIGAGGARNEAAPQASVAPAVVEPTPEPVEVTPTPTPTPPPVEAAAPVAPVVEAVDAVAFRAQANSHLDDMVKDLDDIVLTVAEDGFWRLISNNGELAFNQGQLEILDVPTNVAATWPVSLGSLQGTLDTLTAAIDTQDGPSILVAVEGVRAQVEANRGVVNSAL